MMDWEQREHEEALQLLYDYRAGKITPSSYRSMITTWGKAHLLEARADIEPFLSSPNASIRGNALHVLGGSFYLQEYWSTAVQFLLYDPVDRAREEAITALSMLKNGILDQRTLAVFARVVSDHYDDEDIRISAYQEMRFMVYGHAAYEEWQRLDNPPEVIFNVEREVDWDFVHAAIDTALEEEWKAEAQLLLEDYHQGKVAPQDYYAMLLKFGHANVQESRSVVEHFLSSLTVLLRRIALRVLVLYLRVPGGWQMLVDALQPDRDYLYRQEAATDLGLLMQGTRDKATLRILDPIVSENNEVGMQAYLATPKIYAKHFEEVDDKDIDAFLASPDDSAEIDATSEKK
jgi:hypothetical protein